MRIEQRASCEKGALLNCFFISVYLLPNDEVRQQLPRCVVLLNRPILTKIVKAEMARLDLSHLMFQKLLNGRLHLAPLDDPERILDLGSGTGIWALEMGRVDLDKEPLLGLDLTCFNR